VTRGDLVPRMLALAFQWLTCGPDGRVLTLLVRLIRSVRFLLTVAVLSLVFPGVPLGAQIAMTPPDPARIDADTRGALINRVDTAKRGVGMVVGILTADGRRYLAHGRTAKEGGAEPDQDTVFEIGSITKVFTALLLADMVERGEMRLDDPIAKYLPGVTVPARDGRPITLADLATHTSGLPRLPTNMPMRNPADPYADYGAPLLYQFLSTHTLARAPGEQWEYSNLGAGLLGHILSRHAGTSYEDLLRTRILQPLGMRDTAITLSGDQRRRLATGHSAALVPVPLWEFDALAGAGAIRSTAADLLTFAAACLELTEHPLLPRCGG
jgi:serine-type D-Ala-D-Ala carboxypeptidase/endopeptidase